MLNQHMASKTMVEKLRLPVLKHRDLYQLGRFEGLEFKDVGDMVVTEELRMSFKREEYEDEVLCVRVQERKTRFFSVYLTSLC